MAMEWLRHSRLLACLVFLLLLSEASVEDPKFDKLFSRSTANTPLKLHDSTFSELTDAPRDYFSVVLLTALPASLGCQLCRDFQPEFNLLGQSWRKGDRRGELRTLFGTLDFPDGKETFQRMMLQTAPVLYLFPPTKGPWAKPDNRPIRMDFTQAPQTAEATRSWLLRHLPPGSKPAIRRPFNYARLAAVGTLLLGSISAVTLAGPVVLPLLRNRNLWAAISLVVILAFTSGHMFNHIRKVPYVAGDGHGGISYFAGGFSTQFGIETQIIAAMYGTLAFSTIALALRVPRIADRKQQQFAIAFWSAFIFFAYSLLMSVFKIKNGGYPFHLPPF